MEVEKGVQRWVVNISKWNPSPEYFSFIMSLLPHHEHPFITRFVKMEDCKRALVSRLLQYALVHQVLGIPFDKVIIKRTPEGKPYLVEYDEVKTRIPNFNFNVSHHGDYVAIASEPLCLVGLDIVSHFIPEKHKVEEFIQNFSSYFSRLEWYSIMNAGSPSEMLKEFFRYEKCNISFDKTGMKLIQDLGNIKKLEQQAIRLKSKYWCLKEAFIKAIGTGVGYKLDYVEFHHTMWQNISIKVDGEELKYWRFWLLELDKNHTVAVARGHPRMATINYKKTLKRIQFSEDEYCLSLHLPDVSFILRTVEDLLPCSQDTGTAPVAKEV